MVETKAALARRLEEMTASRDRQIGYLNSAEARIDELETALLGKSEELAALQAEHDALRNRMTQPFHVLMAYGDGEEFWWPAGLYSDHGAMQRAITQMRGVWGLNATDGQEAPLLLDRPLPAWANAIEEGSTTLLYLHPLEYARIEAVRPDGTPCAYLQYAPVEDEDYPRPYRDSWDREDINSPIDVWRYMEGHQPGIINNFGAHVLANSPEEARVLVDELVEEANGKERMRCQQP